MGPETSVSKVNENQIEDLRTCLNNLIEEHGCDSLLHPEIIKLSQILDDIIASYNKSRIMVNA